jgi:hypothetical protein
LTSYVFAAEKDEVTVATPLVVALVPSVAEPTENVITSPFGMGGVEVTVAVKVTGWPISDGFADELTWTVVFADVMFRSTLAAPLQSIFEEHEFAATMSGVPLPFKSPTATDAASHPPDL